MKTRELILETKSKSTIGKILFEKVFGDSDVMELVINYEGFFDEFFLFHIELSDLKLELETVDNHYFLYELKTMIPKYTVELNGTTIETTDSWALAFWVKCLNPGSKLYQHTEEI